MVHGCRKVKLSVRDRTRDVEPPDAEFFSPDSEAAWPPSIDGSQRSVCEFMLRLHPMHANVIRLPFSLRSGNIVWSKQLVIRVEWAQSCRAKHPDSAEQSNRLRRAKEMLPQRGNRR